MEQRPVQAQGPAAIFGRIRRGGLPRSHLLGSGPELSEQVDATQGWQRIVNLYTSWLWQLAGILERLGMQSISELRGRSDLLIYLE